MAEISARDVKALRDRTGAGMMDCKSALAEAGGDVDKAVDLLRERGLAKAGKRAGRATSEGTIGMSVTGSAAGMVELGCETDFVAKTDDFQSLAQDLADLVAGDAGLVDVDALLRASLGGENVEERITAAIAKLGENVQLKRVARLAVEPGVAGGYVHAGGKLGVIVGLQTQASGDEVQALAKDVAMHVAATDPTPIAVDREGVPAEVIEKERVILRKQAEQSGKPEKVIEKIVEGRLAKFYEENCLVEQAFVKDPDQSVGDRVKDVAASAGGEVRVAGFARFKLGEAAEA
jgi:elongation factor Ts